MSRIDPKIFVPRNSRLSQLLLVLAACIFGTTTGYDSAVITGFNIIPAYALYFNAGTVQKSVLTAISFVGAIISAACFGMICNKIGRKNTIIVSAFVKFLGIGLMAGAQSYGMFLGARLILGFGSGISGIGTPVWLAETLPKKTRGRGLSMIFAVYYVGSLVAAGTTYGTHSYPGELGWRIPSAIQAIWSLLSLIIIMFCPESPRWLEANGHHKEALQVVAYTHTNGDITAQETIDQYQEIVDNIAWEKDHGFTMTYLEAFRTPSARKRILLVFSMVCCSTLTGNSVITYFLGAVLDNAGITDTITQLQINVGLQAWNLISALIGSQLVDVLGRRKMGLISAGCCCFFLFIIGALDKLYGSSTDNQAGSYSIVAVIYLFQGSYAFGMTNLTLMYPPEVLTYSLRSVGMAVFTMGNFSFTIFTIFAMPLALKAIGYKMYFINACWDILEFAFIFYIWVETSGKTLEEITEYFEGVKPSDMPHIEIGKLVGKEPSIEKTAVPSSPVSEK